MSHQDQQSSRRRFLPLLVLILTVIIIVSVAGYLLFRLNTGFRDVQVEPGTEIFAIDTNLISELSYETPDLRILALRTNAHGRQFRIYVTSKTSGCRQDCVSGAGFNKVLKALSSIKACRSYKSSDTKSVYVKHPVDLGALVLRDVTRLEPTQRAFRGSSDLSEIIASDGFQAYEVDISPEVFKLLRGGCSSLALK